MDNREGKFLSSNRCLAAIAVARQQTRQSRYHTSLQLGLSSCLPVSDFKSQACYRNAAAQRRCERAEGFRTMCFASPASAIANVTSVKIPTSAINTTAAVPDASIAQNALTTTSVFTTSTAINLAPERRTAASEAVFPQEQAPLKQIAATVDGIDSDEAHRSGSIDYVLRRRDIGSVRQRQLDVNVGNIYDPGSSSTGSSSGSSSSGLTNFTEMNAAVVATVSESDIGGGSVLFDTSDSEPECGLSPNESLSRLSTTYTATHTSSSRSSFSGSGRDVDGFRVYCAEDVSGSGFSGDCGNSPLIKTSSCPSPLALTSSHPFDGGFRADSFAHEVSKWIQLSKDVRQLHDLEEKKKKAHINDQIALSFAKQTVRIASESEKAGNTAKNGCSAGACATVACENFAHHNKKFEEAREELGTMVENVATAAMEFPVYGIAYRLEAAARCGAVPHPAVEWFDVQDPTSGLPGRAVLLMWSLLHAANRGQSPTQPHLHPQHNHSCRASSSKPKHARAPFAGSGHMDERLEMACLQPAVGGLMALTWAVLAHHDIRTPLLYHEYELLWNMLAELLSSYMTTGSPTAPQLTYHAHLTTMGNLLAIVRSYTAAATAEGGGAATSRSDTLSALGKLSRQERITAFRSLVKNHVEVVGQMLKKDLGETEAAVAAAPLRRGGRNKNRTTRPTAEAGQSTGGRSGGAGGMGSAGTLYQNEREGILNEFKELSERWVKTANAVALLKAALGCGGAGRDAEANHDVMLRLNRIALFGQWRKVVCSEPPGGGGGVARGGSARGGAGSKDGRQQPIILRNLKTEAAARAELARELLALEYGERPRQVLTVGTAPMLLVLRAVTVLSELRAAASPTSMRPPGAPPAAVSEPRFAGSLSLEGSNDMCGPIGIQLITRQKLQEAHESPMHRSGASSHRPCVVEMQLVTCPLPIRAVLAAEAAVDMTMMTAPGTRVRAGGAFELIRVPHPGDSRPYDASCKLTRHQLKLHQDVEAALRSRRLAVVQPDSKAALESALVMLARWRHELPLAPGRSILVVPYIPDLAAHVSMRDPIRQLKEMVGMAGGGGGAQGVSGGLGSSDGTPDPRYITWILRPDWPLRRRLGLTCLLSHFLGWADGTGGDNGGDPKPCSWDSLGYQRLAAEAAAAQQQSTSSSCELLPLPLLVVLDCAVGGGELGVRERL